MDEYDQFDIEYGAKLIIRGAIGTVIAGGLCAIAYLVILQSNALRIFRQIYALQDQFFGAINPVIITLLVVLAMGCVSTTTWILPSFNPVDSVPIAIAGLIIWIIVGFVMGFISKNSWKGAEAGFWATLLTFITTIILALISVFNIGLLVGGTYAAFFWFLVIIGSAYLTAFSFGISMLCGFLGGYISSKMFELTEY
jgi:hypothetical protein